MKQLCLFIEDQLVYSKNQSGFRKNHSTNTLLIKLRDGILNAQDRGEVTIAVLTYFSKAFDTVDFAALLQKLLKLNFSKEALKFILSYLTYRKQFVQIDDKISSNKTVKFRVPQGSILGPVLFNIYVSDMNTVCEGSTCLQYTDDSNIYNHFKPADIPESITKLQTNINEVHKWSKGKNLIFNPDKTKFMIFSTKKSQARCTKYTFQADNKIILERTDATKILGVNFQQQLNWDCEVNEITRSCYGVLRTLRKIKRITLFKIRKHSSESLVLSKIDYCNSVFDPLTQAQEQRLQKVQNAAAAFVLNRYCTITDIVKLNWLPVRESVQMNLSNICFKAVHFKNFPTNLSLQPAPKPRRPLLCNDRGFLIEKSGHKNSFRMRAVNIFNELPRQLRDIDGTQYTNFKKEARNYFLKVS